LINVLQNAATLGLQEQVDKLGAAIAEAREANSWYLRVLTNGSDEELARARAKLHVAAGKLAKTASSLMTAMGITLSKSASLGISRTL
jgi:hypothetical protein